MWVIVLGMRLRWKSMICLKIFEARICGSLLVVEGFSTSLFPGDEHTWVCPRVIIISLNLNEV